VLINLNGCDCKKALLGVSLKASPEHLTVRDNLGVIKIVSSAIRPDLSPHVNYERVTATARRESHLI
jgi:hypothetical protein